MELLDLSGIARERAALRKMKAAQANLEATAQEVVALLRVSQHVDKNARAAAQSLAPALGRVRALIAAVMDPATAKLGKSIRDKKRKKKAHIVWGLASIGLSSASVFTCQLLAHLNDSFDDGTRYKRTNDGLGFGLNIFAYLAIIVVGFSGAIGYFIEEEETVLGEAEAAFEDTAPADADPEPGEGGLSSGQATSSQAMDAAHIGTDKAGPSGYKRTASTTQLPV